MPTEELHLRPAEPDDGGEVAALHLAARRAAYPDMPRPVHPDEEVLAFVASTLGADHLETWVAEDASGVVGYATLTATWLDALYVAPARRREGVGTALLDLAKALRPEGFGLWVFASNAPARAFYRRHGLEEHETTDGSDNEEGWPDVRLTWAGTPRPPGPGPPDPGRLAERPEAHACAQPGTDRFVPTPTRGK